MAMSIFFLQQQVARKRGRGQGLKHLQHLAQILHEEEKDIRPNPVTQNVKIIMVCKIRFYINWSSISSMKCISLKFICSLGLLMFSYIYFQHHLKYLKFFYIFVVVGWSFNGALSQPISCQQKNHGYDGTRRGQHSVQRA